MSRKMNRMIYWAPRVLSIFFILFLAVFSLDIFSLNLNFSQTIVGLFIHNIPVIVLSVVLIIAWRYEVIGGIICIIAGLVYIGFFLTSPGSESLRLHSIIPIIIISGPALLIGALFIVNWYYKNKNEPNGYETND